MKININPLLLIFAIALLVSCSSIKNSAETNNRNDKITNALDAVFIDYTPTIPETKYQVFRAEKDGNSGWMNVDGEWIITPEYDTEFKRDWSEGVVTCRKDGLYGAVNYKNEIVIPFEYPFPPYECEDGLILVRDSLRQEAYFSKLGVQMTDFIKRQVEFINGFAVIRTNRERYASYPRINSENKNARTDIYKGDFVVVNTQFDTLLQFDNVPFLLEFGTLNNNRRTFFLYPFMGLHADIGISYGQYGYLDRNGNIAVEPKFRASDVFTPLAQGFVRLPDCPFNSNLAKVREGDDYYFIDTLGNEKFEITTHRERLYDVSNFNDFGIAGYRTFGKVANSSMIHLIDSTGAIVHEAYESDAPMSTGGGAIGHQPRKEFIPIYDMKNGVFRLNAPDFSPFASFPIKDSSTLTNFQYRGFLGNRISDNFILTQFKKTKNSYGYPGSHQRLIDQDVNAKSSWFSFKSILSSKFGNFTLVDSTSMTTTLYDFDKNVLFECDSCFFHYDFKYNLKGVYKVHLANRDLAYVNYKGKILSDLFDSAEKDIYDLSNQVKTFNELTPHQLNAKEEEFEELFNTSIMYSRIMK
ncbi:WG repeat-containing protein [Brumimicrobium oceani]|uniref:WG repeat-containing protein n=1 Tax=Brumimicrobium oceani TaxID=2100725 RepID=A0A2U2XD99_9FLAO|nr:WG repeat-containing protein [Brumimicrobium oceani]PWH85748.1 hypothetical protein DIT68_06550 [Brumimicrobium oceani]